MTLHPRGRGDISSDVVETALDQALRIARACSHSRRLERPIAAAFEAQVALNAALVERLLHLEAAVERRAFGAAS